MQRLNASDAGFADAFDALVNGRREADADVSSVVTQTIRDVRARGDVTLAEMTQLFDGFDLNAAGWHIDAAQGSFRPKSHRRAHGHRGWFA